jgi:hypothetical protein
MKSVSDIKTIFRYKGTRKMISKKFNIFRIYNCKDFLLYIEEL